MSFRSLGVATVVSLTVSTMCAAQVTDQTTTQSVSTGAGQSTDTSAAPSETSNSSMTSSVAVIPFENRSPSAPGDVADTTGRTMADHLQRSLEKTGKFKAVERSSVDTAVAQSPRVNGRFDSTVEKKLGTDLGAKYVVYGTVTQNDVQEKTDSFKLPGAIRIESKETEGTVAVTLTAVDATTGDVVATATGTSEEDGDRDIEIRDKHEGPATTTDLGDSADILDEASEEAVDNAAKNLAEKLP